jgi:acyl dehydratase
MSISPDADAFDRARRPLVPARTFDQLRVGEAFPATSWTLNDVHASAFQAVSADHHPVHNDVEWAHTQGHSVKVVAPVHNQREQLVHSDEHCDALRRSAK